MISCSASDLSCLLAGRSSRMRCKPFSPIHPPLLPRQPHVQVGGRGREAGACAVPGGIGARTLHHFHRRGGSWMGGGGSSYFSALCAAPTHSTPSTDGFNALLPVPSRPQTTSFPITRPLTTSFPLAHPASSPSPPPSLCRLTASCLLGVAARMMRCGG